MKSNRQQEKQPAFLLPALLLAGLLAGCAGAPTADGEPNPDPAEGMNRAFYKFNDALDRRVMKPAAKGYIKVTSAPMRSGVTSFFDNLRYLNVVLHSFLQGKVGQGFADASRFVVNSSVGVGGLFDPAASMGLEKHQEDFGQTLATWGVGRGAYLYFPFFGPNTARNTPDFAGSYFTNPLSYFSTVLLFPVTALNLVNTRANLLETTEFVDEAALDPYSFTREAYLQRREYLIHDGDPPAEDFDEMFDAGLDELEDLEDLEE